MRPAGIPKTSDICVSLGLSQTSYYALPSVGKGISWGVITFTELYYCDCVWPRSCIDGLVLVYSSPRVVRFAKLHRRTRFGL